jgi:hypothetical protein
MIVRSDLCPPGTNGTCKLSFLGSGNSFFCNHADGGGAGGGVLFTKLAPHLLQSSNPNCAGLGPASFAACLGTGAPEGCMEKGSAGAGPARRRLAEAPPGGGGGGLITLNRISPSGYGEDLAGVAATAHFEKVDNATVSQDPDEPLPVAAATSAAPGIPLAVQLRLRDQWGRNVTGRIADASMIMQVGALDRSGLSRACWAFDQWLGLGWGPAEGALCCRQHCKPSNAAPARARSRPGASQTRSNKRPLPTGGPAVRREWVHRRRSAAPGQHLPRLQRHTQVPVAPGGKREFY